MNLQELNTSRIQKKNRAKMQIFQPTSLESHLNILQPLINTNLRTIVQVYQADFVNEKSPGLGDFLRGSFYLMQLAGILNVDFKIDISNHPISEFIVNNGKRNDINYNNIEFLMGLNRCPVTSFSINPPNNRYFDLKFTNSIIKKLNQSSAQNVGLFSNAFPIFYHFSEYGRNIIRSYLMPNKTMIEYIKNAFDSLQLQPNTYGVIHIRTGDEYLSTKRGDLPPDYTKIIQIITSVNNPNKKYLILSDNYSLKSRLKKYQNFYVYMHNIEHLGSEINYNKSTIGIKNTLLEFYLMSYSNSILSLSVYDHISGFSKYCSELYNIPFKNIKIGNNSKSNIIKLNI